MRVLNKPPPPRQLGLFVTVNKLVALLFIFEITVKDQFDFELSNVKLQRKVHEGM